MSSDTEPAVGVPSTGNQGEASSTVPESSNAALSSTSSYQTPNRNTISLIVDPECPKADKHGAAFFCDTCRSIPMSWGITLPRAYGMDGKLITVGPQGSALEGVDLQDEEAIAVLCTIVYCDNRGLHYQDPSGLLELMDKHPKSVEAGQRITEMYQVINRAARKEEGGLPPYYYEVIESCLQNPCQDAETFVIETLAKLSRFQDLPEGYKPEIPSPSFGASSQSLATLETSTDLDSGSDGMGMSSRPTLTASKAHTPAPSGDWKFADGTDMTDAVVGKPEPWKWFLVRQDKNDHNKVDIREYPRIRGFDWNDPNDVKALNKNRKQVFDRTDAPEKGSRPMWTLLEKQTLEDIIREDLKAGKTAKTLDWNSIAERLEKKFENVTQKEGVALAQTSKLIKGKWALPLKKNPKLPKERVGPAKRNASAVSIQARKYHGILALINDAEDKKENSNSTGMMGNDEEGVDGAESKAAILGDGSPKLKKRKRVAGEEQEMGETFATDTAHDNANDQGYTTVSKSKAHPKTPTPKKAKKDVKGKATQAVAKHKGPPKSPPTPMFPNLK